LHEGTITLTLQVRSGCVAPVSRDSGPQPIEGKGDAVKTDALRGILPAVVTPFDPDGRFEPRTFERLLERVYAAGVHGVYVCGSTGEGMLQPVSQRKAVAEAAVAGTPPGCSVVVHVGAAAVDDARALAAHAQQIGAHAVSSLPPMSGGFDFNEVRTYYEMLARASDLPLLVYYFPELSTAISSAEQLETLCRIPNVVGVKFTAFDLYRMSLVLRPERRVFSGHDEVLAAGLLMGADGGIGSFYNLVPDLFVRIYSAATAGRWQEAREVQQQVNRLIRLSLQFPLFPAIKQMLAWSGLECGSCLPPRSALTDTQQAALRQELIAEGFEGLSGADR
jgi:N-acetylneuraminate lyase